MAIPADQSRLSCKICSGVRQILRHKLGSERTDIDRIQMYEALLLALPRSEIAAVESAK